MGDWRNVLKTKFLILAGMALALSACSTPPKSNTEGMTWAEYDHESFLVQNNLGQNVTMATIYQDLDHRAFGDTMYSKDLVRKAKIRFRELGISLHENLAYGVRQNYPHIVLQFITNYQGETPEVDSEFLEEGWWIEGLDGDVFQYYVLATITHDGRKIFEDRLEFFHRRDFGEYEFNPQDADKKYRLLYSYKRMNDIVLEEFFRNIRDRHNFKLTKAN